MEWNEIIALAVAVILWAPLSVALAQLLKRVSWPDGVKALVSVVAAVIVGVASTWPTGELLGIVGSWGELTSAQIIAYAGVVFAAAQLWYHTYLAGVPWMKRLALFNLFGANDSPADLADSTT